MLRRLREKLRTDNEVDLRLQFQASAQEDKYGLFLLTDESSKTPGFDIVAVHGLGGAYDKTWTADNGSFWLEEFLSVDAAHARVFSYGYDSSTFFSRGVTRIEDEALILLNRVYGVRSTPEQRARPICFIGHSLGGIIIKKTLILAHEHSSRFGDLLEHVKAVVFFGVPHRGADIAFWGHFAAQITKAAQMGLGTNDRFVKDLRAGSPVLADISTQFIHRAAELKLVYTFFETARLNGVLIVDQESARLKIPNEVPDAIHDADHKSICKFQRLDSQAYIAVRECFKELMRELQSPTTNESKQRMIDDKALALRQSLAFPTMEDRYFAIDSPTPGTCEWLFGQRDFQVWRDPKSNEPLSGRLLWLKGNAGAGKSTLMKAMCENSRQQPSAWTLCFFFNTRSPNQTLDNSFCGMLRSFLWRLLTYDLSLLFVTPELRELKHPETGAEDWHLDKVKDIFSRYLRKVQGHPVYLYIDALDECPEGQARAAVRFFETLAEQTDVLRVLISSRYCPFISHRGREIEMEPHNAPDIWRYIDAHMPSTVDGQSSQSLRNLIGTRSSGIFLWTVITVNEVIRANDQSLARSQIQALVEESPRDLKPMIEDILRRIDPVHGSKACLIFNWVLLASDTLQPLEVFAMIRFDPHNSAANDASQWQSDYATIKRAITSFSGGLLEVKSTRDGRGRSREYVQFIHESVRDHLQTSRSLKGLLTGSLMSELIPNHASLAEFCIEYIGQVPGFRSKRLDGDEIAKLLNLHAEIFRLFCGIEVDSFFDVAEDQEALMKACSNAKPNAEQRTRLSEYLSSDTWISDLIAWNITPQELRVFLHRNLELQFKCGNLHKTIKLLAPFRTRGPRMSSSRPTALLRHWQHDTIRSMYQQLKTPFALLPRTINEFFVHLELAQDITVVERLTDFLVVENSTLRTNLLDSIIRILNTYFIAKEFQADRFRALYTNSVVKRFQAGRIHFDRWQDCASNERHSPDWQNQASMRLAAGLGLCSSLGKLLNLSARNLNVEDCHGRIPLVHALKSGHASTSALLLQKGAKLDTKEGRGFTANAIMLHGTDFAEALISNLVESKDRASILERLLVSSVYASELNLIDCLSKGGADVNAKFDEGRDSLILAAWLTKREPETITSNNFSELLMQRRRNPEGIIDTLLRHGATPHCVDRFGRTALHYLAGRSDCEAVGVLLKGKPNINALDLTGQTPLDFAITCGNHGVAELLRLHGAISASCAEEVRVHNNQRFTLTEDSEGWEIDRDQGSPPWESGSED